MYRLGLVMILIAIGINVIQFKKANERAKNYKAIYLYKSKNIIEAGSSYSRSIRYRVSPFYYFGIINPNSNIIIPSKKRIYTWFNIEPSMLTFGQSKEIRHRDYDPYVDPGVLDQYKVDLHKYASEHPNTRSPLAERLSIFRRSPAARTFVVFAPEGDPGRDKPMVFVDIDLLDEFGGAEQ